jgi:hypothetical protein
MPKLPFRSSDPAGPEPTPVEDRIEELQREVGELRQEVEQAHVDRPAAQPDDEDRARLIKQGRSELPKLDEQVEKGIDDLRRLAAR